MRSDLADHPHGRFAEGAGTRTTGVVVAAPVESTSPTGPSALPTPKAAGPGPARRGPATADELAIAGVATGDEQLAAFRGAWAPGKGTLSYSDSRAAFVARSPAVAEAVQRFRASYERYGQVAALDDLVRQYDAFAEKLMTNATTPILRPSLAKRFPFNGVADLQGRIVDVDVALARIALERDLLAALADFEAAWQEAYYWQHALGIVAGVSDLAERVVEAAKGRYRAGGTSHANLIQAELREEALRVRHATARARRTSAKTSLAAALDLPADALDGVSLRLDAPLPERPARSDVAAATLAHGPTVATARAARERAALMVQLAERQLQPNLAEGAAVPGSGARPAAADLAYATGGPFLRELQVREQAAADALAGAERQAPARAEEAWVTLDDAVRRRLSSAGHQLARAQQGVDVSERGYRAGTATFLDLDSAVQLYLATALDAWAALRDAHVAAARLATLVGAGPAASPTAPTEDPHD
ncbi:MAG: hypothetical protein CVU56_20225 [Deltaproteobacteria bacterium HGW-Deltaproteobacteria-14]|nr:MAG: hypothetical protein CVU56_20225 [Deltaproteobacteria bacterium HGW-Deltaproteobacteria-14]